MNAIKGLVVKFGGLLALVVAPSCALLNPQPKLPSLEEVLMAKQANAEEWQQLQQIISAWQAQGIEVLPSLNLVSESAHTSLRVKALIQDIELEYVQSVQVAKKYYQRWQKSRNADDAYLAARIAANDLAIVLTTAALELDPDHLPAKVLWLGLGATPTDTSPLISLIKLLHENPGCAEAWRVLAELAPFYARPDLSSAAAEVEPWLPVNQPEGLLLLRAETKLDEGDAKRAYELLQVCKNRPGKFLRAKALVELGEIASAHSLLVSLVSEEPDDPVAHFNLGILAREYLHDNQLAKKHFAVVMDLAELGFKLPVLQLTQAQIWHEQL